jgi:hypothetical protein
MAFDILDQSKNPEMFKIEVEIIPTSKTLEYINKDWSNIINKFAIKDIENGSIKDDAEDRANTMLNRLKNEIGNNVFKCSHYTLYDYTFDALMKKMTDFKKEKEDKGYIVNFDGVITHYVRNYIAYTSL